MPIIKGRNAARSVMESVISRKAAMPIFCTASHWNTEAILLAAKKFCDKYQIESIPLSVAMTFNYRYMPQAQRVTHTKIAKLGFLSCMEHLHVLCDTPDSPYARIQVLPHLDHANPESDKWALTEGSEYLASAMFDAQTYPPEENLNLTRQYVDTYGKKLLVEGILEELPVASMHVKSGTVIDDYPEKAENYVRHTGVDFLVADLGTEQQSSGSSCHYLQTRAAEVTRRLGKPMLVLHGTSSLSPNEMGNLPHDGVVRVNMWTKIAREAGQYAASNLFRRAPEIYANDFEAAESNRYLFDSIDKASDMMLEVLEKLNYIAFATTK
ncbi:MAG: class II fructose-bisphosphate aldolase [Victivallaceae bacterium]|nr:class II fructose-bisphosphate aldolase [Victivallaceae bacterium]